MIVPTQTLIINLRLQLNEAKAHYYNTWAFWNRLELTKLIAKENMK